MLLLLRNTLNAERNGCYCMIVTEQREINGDAVAHKSE